jgi:hypothetical protein
MSAGEDDGLAQGLAASVTAWSGILVAVTTGPWVCLVCGHAIDLPGEGQPETEGR